jgi:formyltetrahydrofolate synthetase
MKREYSKFLEETIGIDNTKVVNTVDPVNQLPDPFTGVNAPILNLYATGDSFKINDNSKLYEIIKLFKDLTDKHQYLQSLTYAIDVNNKLVKFTVVTDNDHIISKAMLDGILNMLATSIAMKFGDTFDFNYEVRDIMGDIGPEGFNSALGKKQLTIIVSEKSEKKEEKK